MRQLGIAIIAAAALTLFSGPALAAKVEVKGPHLCCGQCVKVVKGVLAKVKGVSDVNADRDTKTVTFTATDAKAAQAGLKALHAGGFFGQAMIDDKEVTPKAYTEGDKVDEITVKGVHSCCGQCRKALTKLFGESKVSFSGKGPQQDVKISGKDLDKGKVLEALNKAGFNGTVEK